MARKIYDKETKTGWKRIEGQWQYFDNGLVKLPGTDQIKFLKAATGAVYQAGVNTRSTVHNFVEQDKKLRAKQRQSKIQEYKDLGTAVSNFDLKKEIKEEGGRVVKNLGNALSDFTKIGQGSGEFKEGRELSIFELRRQNEKYRTQLETESLEEIELPEGGDFYSLALMDNYTGELGSDYNKTWESVDTSNFDAYQNINFKNAMSETYWLTEAVNGPTYSLQTKENSYTNLAKNNDLKQMGGTQPNDTANLAAASGVKTNDTPSYIPPTVSNQSSTAVDSATANLPAQAQTRAAEVAKADPKVTQWYDLEGEDGGAAAKALWKQNNQPEQVKIDPIEFKDPVQSSLLFRDLQPETAINPLRNA